MCLRVVILVLGGLGLAQTESLRAQASEPLRIEVPGMDFRPDGAWRRRAKLVREHRHALLRGGNFASLNASAGGLLFQRTVGGSATAITGNFFVPVVVLAYSDVPAAFGSQAFQDAVFSPTPVGQAYSLKTFYEQASGGRITMDGSVFPIVIVDTTAAFYEDGCNGVTIFGVTQCPIRPVSRLGLLLVGALNKLSNGTGADTLWNRYDNDGPDGLPNSGDDDGVVDFITFLHPKIGGECQKGATGIWAHRWQVQAVNGGSRYVTKTPRRDAQGQPIAGAFLQIDDYTIQSQLGGSTGCEAGILPVGTIAHETGHAFGLPDLYDTQRGTAGIGEWGLMGSGNFTRAYSPSSFGPWSLSELGWITLVPLQGSQTVATGARQLSDTVFIAQADNPSQYLLIENRQAAGSDTAQMNPTYARAKSPGLLLWHIDQSIVDTRYQSVNSGVPQGVIVLQADGRGDLGRGANRGDTGDSYPGSTGNTRFSLTTAPSARDHSGAFLGFIVDSIQQQPNRAIRFRFTRRGPSSFRPLLAGTMVRINGAPWSEYIDVVPEGESITVSADSVQSLLGGRTIATWLSWSDGGSRTHTIVSGATPDTLTAPFRADHRVLVANGVGGQVTSDRPGDLGVGVFLPAGTTVRLTAVASPGFTFTGWVGDTVSSLASLTLPMARPYDLVSSFIGEVAVSGSDAVGELLGASALTAAQRDFLDALGNRNGVFDIGDYLAYLSRLGQVPSPDHLRQLSVTRRTP